MEWVAELLLVVGLCYLWFGMYSDGDVSNLGCKTYTQSNGHISNNPRDQIHIHYPMDLFALIAIPDISIAFNLNK